MRTPIGRVVVHTVGLRDAYGWELWFTELEVHCSVDHTCGTPPSLYLVHDYVCGHEAWVSHALFVGTARLGMELPAGSDNGAPYTAQERAAALRRIFPRNRPIPPPAVAMVAFAVFTGEMPPAPALAPTASPAKALAAS